MMLRAENTLVRHLSIILRMWDYEMPDWDFGKWKRHI